MPRLPPYPSRAKRPIGWLVPDVLSLSSPLAFAALCAVGVAGLAALGVSARLEHRAGIVLGAGLALGLVTAEAGLTGPAPDAVRAAARLGLALLAFTAALQCPPSRAARLSPAALRLAVLAAPGLTLVTAAAVFALKPSLGPWAALLVGAALPLGVGAFDERQALGAPLETPTKRAVRVDGALSVALGVPLALLLEAVSVGPAAGAPITEAPGFALFAGAAVGGTVGLLCGRMVPVRDARLPAAPFVAFALAYVGALALGFDPVMAGAAAGLLYAEEAPLLGPVRSRLFSAGARWLGPPALFALGALLGPVALGGDLLAWLAALVPVLALRAVLRRAALGGVSLPAADRGFLSWFGGGPGAGAALFTLSLMGSASPGAQADALGIAALGTMAGVIAARIGSGPLVTRQVRAAARARRRRYGTA